MKRLDNKKLLAEATLAIRKAGSLDRAYKATPEARADLRAMLAYMAKVSRTPVPPEARRTHKMNLANAERRRETHRARQEWLSKNG